MHFTRSALSAVLAICTFCTSALAAPSSFSRSTAVTLKDIATFPNGTWIENSYVRSNGQILVSLLTSPDIYEVDPTGKVAPKLVLSIPGYLGLLGFAELQEDVFAVIAGNFSLATFETTIGKLKIYAPGKPQLVLGDVN